MFNLFHADTASMLAVFGSVIIPALSALFVRAKLSMFWVGLGTLVIATANGFVTTWIDAPTPNHYDWYNALGISLGSLVVAFLTHNVWTAGTTEYAKLHARGVQ